MVENASQSNYVFPQPSKRIDRIVDILYCHDVCIYMPEVAHCTVVVTHQEIDTHPRNTDHVLNDESIADHDIATFMSTGSPSPSLVCVRMSGPLSIYKLVPIALLRLVHRPLSRLGSPVKSGPNGPLHGIVVDCKTTYVLKSINSARPLAHVEGNVTTLEDKDPNEHVLVRIPHEELQEDGLIDGDVIVKNNWIGMVTTVNKEDVAVWLANDSVVTLAQIDNLPVGFQIGDTVTAKKSDFKNGRWAFGMYNPDLKPTGRIVSCDIMDVGIEWLHHNPHIHPHDLCPSHHPNHNLRPQDGGFKILNGSEIFELNHVVQFKNPEAALAKYPISGTSQVQLSDGTMHSNIFKPRPKSETMGYDLSYYRVISIECMVKIKWQDGTEDTRDCTEVYPLVEWDDDELQPGCIVMPRNFINKDVSSEDYNFCKVGVVQSIDPLERIAKVRWSLQADFNPGHYTVIQNLNIQTRHFPLGPETLNSITQVPIYDLKLVEFLAMNPGDLISAKHPPSNQTMDPHVPWCGIVKHVNLDGSVTIQAESPFFEIVTVSPEDYVVIDYDDQDSHGMSIMDDNEDDWDSDIDDSSDDASSPEAMEIWYENEEGERLSVDGDGDPESWETDSETEQMSSLQSDELENDPMAIDIPDIDDSVVEPIPDPLLHGPPQYELLEANLPHDHRYMADSSDHHDQSQNTQRLKRIRKEHSVISSSLPGGIYVRSWESRLDLFRVLFVGPIGTPYELAPLLIDFWFPPQFPHKPPEASFHSWTDGQGPINPNLYENGRICLSLLNT
jgi:ubiquitin-conjugating enzyme E2 O